MSALDKLAENDLVSNAIFEAIALRPRRTARTGFIGICCPMCVIRGESRPDRDFRCGIIQGDGIGINCFNCGLKAKYRVGEPLSKTMQDFLHSLGASSQEIKRLKYWADTMQTMMAARPDVQSKLNVIASADFKPIPLPPTARSLEHWAEMDCTNANFLDAAAYLFSRGDVAVNATTYYWTPETETHQLNRRLIIPCYHRDKVVGWIARGISADIEPPYFKELPPNYLFNSRFLTIPDRKYILIVEGAFDALAVDGIAALGASLNETQIAWIIQSGKQPVVVADRDKAGSRLVKVAIRQGWPVATMHYGRHQWWDADIKDAADAAKRYGKLYTLQSILSNLTWNETQITQRIQYRIE